MKSVQRQSSKGVENNNNNNNNNKHTRSQKLHINYQYFV